MARPSKPAKNGVIRFRLPEEDKAEFDRLCENLGRTSSDVLRAYVQFLLETQGNNSQGAA